MTSNKKIPKSKNTFPKAENLMQCETEHQTAANWNQLKYIACYFTRN